MTCVLVQDWTAGKGDPVVQSVSRHPDLATAQGQPWEEGCSFRLAAELRDAGDGTLAPDAMAWEQHGPGEPWLAVLRVPGTAPAAVGSGLSAS